MYTKKQRRWGHPKQDEECIQRNKGDGDPRVIKIFLFHLQQQQQQQQKTTQSRYIHGIIITNSYLFNHLVITPLSSVQYPTLLCHVEFT